MTDFHILRVKDIQRETEDTVSITMDVPQQLKKLFAYKQGQYLTFKKDIDGEDLRRSYSLCSSPVTDEDWQVAVKKVENGKFSTYANETLKAGDVLEVMAPMGSFYTEVKEGQKKNYSAFVAGSGITPVMSIIKTVLHTETDSSFVLYYGNKNTASTIFKKELDALSEKYADRLTVHYVMSREEVAGAIKGRINAEMCLGLVNDHQNIFKADEYFLCGPEEMIFSVKDELSKQGVSKDNIHFELFNTPVQKENDSSSDEDSIVLDAEVMVIIDGEEHEFTLNSKGDSILDAAMDAGADVPFSCKGAVCCTCRAKLVEGKARMALNYSLTDKEVEEGYILTCQSHPTTEKVVVDYDAD